MWKKFYSFLGLAAFVVVLLLACAGCTSRQQATGQNDSRMKFCVNHGGVKNIARKRIDLGTRFKIEFVTTYMVCGDGKVESFHILTAQPSS